MTLMRRLQGWCLYLMLVCTGTLGAALCLLWLGARLAPLTGGGAGGEAGGGGPHPMEPVVIGLVMGIAASGIACIVLEFAARLLPGLRAVAAPLRAALASIAARLRAALAGLPPRARLGWGLAALAVAVLLVDLI